MSDIATWDYGRSVSEVKTLVLKWSTLTVDLVDKLYKAREALSNRGSRPDIDDSQNWSGYCKDIGLPRSTAHTWLERYIPEEHKLLTVEELETKKQQEERAKKQASQSEYQKSMDMVREYRKTKKKPAGWTSKEEAILKEDNARDERIKNMQRELLEESKKREAEKVDYKKITDDLSQMTNDFFQKIEKRQTFKESIRISHEGKEDPFVDAIMDYLETLADDNRRVEACYNIIKVCKGIANQLQSGKPT